MNLSNLRELSLSHGSDLSTVPLVSLMNLSSSLTSLNLENCQLHGELPQNIFQSHKLQSLDLRGNHLSGPIPCSSLNLESLIYLDLASNNFIGQLPEVFSNSTKKFSSYDSSKYPPGSFPSNLNSLYLSGNLLNGTIPSWIFELPYLVSLDIGLNSLTGEIRNFHSTSLQYLFLGGNELHGVIPRSIFQQVKLQYLDLSSNNFTVIVELEDLTKLKELEILYLSSNNVSWNFNSSKNYTLNNRLDLVLSSCNLIEFPPFLKSVQRLGSLDLSSNQLHGSVPKWLWEVGFAE
ncbi:hypothetical protein TIFTF001_031214 [Ficus carica]|uniref:Uncharacterized protein n=1 Tax=Ficus carica TaxID=3494 RepID=A0AA88DV22_FICCA|nr:hypothetical protein TIFTF001_031214 [Ficus carica]